MKTTFKSPPAAGQVRVTGEGEERDDGNAEDGAPAPHMQGVSDTVWKVGCYKINPSTPSGQKFFILHMLVLPLIPITALVIQNSVTMNTLLGYQSRVSTIRRQVRGAMEIAVFIQNIQEERAEVALYIFTNQTNAVINSSVIGNANNNRMGIQERFRQTDRALEEVPTWPNIDKSLTNTKVIPIGVGGADGTEAFKSKLKFQIQHEVFRVKVREGRFGEITEILAWYEYINDVILDHLDDEIKSTNKSGVWRYLISFKNLLRAIENIGIVSVYGIRYLTTGNVTQQNFIKYVEHDTLIWEYLNSSIHLAPYLEKKFRKIYEGEAYRFYRKSDKVILNNALDLDKGSSDISSALKYFNSITDYMMQLRQALEELRDDIESVAQDELNAADQEKMIGIAILSFISLVTLVFYFFVKNALSVIRVFAKEVMEKVRELDAEKMKTEKAFHDFLPTTVVRDLKKKKILAENFDCVSIFFGDIIGFNELTSDCTANELIEFMNLFYATLDTRISKFKVYNVHTMADEFMVVSGMPNKIGDRHVSEIASMALDLLAGSVVFQIPHRPNSRLNIRMGVHSGPACGVVAGSKIPNYCVMSDTANIARVMEKMGEGMRIHISATAKELLDKVGGFRCEYRGVLDIGRGQIETFWLIGPDKEPDSDMACHDNMEKHLSIND